MPAGDEHPERMHAETVAALERLQDDEALTSNLDNAGSILLLKWTEERIYAIEKQQRKGKNRKAQLNDLFLLCRGVNCLNQTRGQMSDVQFVLQILGMLDSAGMLFSE